MTGYYYNAQVYVFITVIICICLLIKTKLYLKIRICTLYIHRYTRTTPPWERPTISDLKIFTSSPQASRTTKELSCCE